MLRRLVLSGDSGEIYPSKKEVFFIPIDVATLIVGIAMLMIAFAALVVQIIQAARAK